MGQYITDNSKAKAAKATASNWRQMVRNTTDTGKITKGTVKVYAITIMASTMTVIGSMITKMDMDYTQVNQAIVMKGNGSMMRKMEKVGKFGVMEPNMRGII